MRLSSAILVFVGCALLACASRAHAQTVFTVETPRDGRVSSFVAHRVSTTDTTRAVAQVAHRSDWAPLATLSHRGNLIALLNVPPQGEARHASELVLVDVSSGQTRTLARELQQVPAIFSRDDATVYVVRSREAPPPSGDEMRRGHLENERLSVLAVDLVSGATHTVREDVAYMLHPIGVADTGELIAIRAAWEGHSLVAIDPRNGRARTLRTTQGQGFRDASLNDAGGTVTVLEPAPQSARVLRVNIANGSTEVVREGVSIDASPIAVSASSFVWTDSSTRLQWSGAATTTTLWTAPATTHLRAVSSAANASLLAFEIVSPTSREVWTLSTETGACIRLSQTASSVLRVVGIAPPGAAL